MAAYTDVTAKTATLGASVVDTYTLKGTPNGVEVVHHGNVATPLYVIVGGAIAAPTVAGDGAEVVLPGERVRFSKGSSNGTTVVSVISAGAATVSVINLR